MPPEFGVRDADSLRLVAAVVRRRWWQGIALAILIISILVSSLSVGLPDVPRTLLAVLATIGGAVAVTWTSKQRSRQAAAAAIERVRPCRNLVVTAEELERYPARASHALRTRIEAEASKALEGLRPGNVVPIHATVLALVVSLAVVILSLAPAREVVRDTVQRLSNAVPLMADSPVVRVSVTPPAYTGRPSTSLTNPRSIEALEGSRIGFELSRGWRIRFGDVVVAGEVLARDSGYFAIESTASAAPPLLIPLNVVADRAPSVRIAAPAKDLLLPDAARTIAIALSATDDLALQSLELRYTRVSGAGEQFEFVEGTLPVTISRGSEREWRAEGQLALASLRLRAGDSLVYRAVARDRRPGAAGSGTSDTYYIEIAGPGQLALEGVEMPPQMERYAMSQQMIVLKLERLRKREPGMSRADLVEETAALAAEQRSVRANFVFLLGGHVEDEEEEAAQSHEIQEGRLENTARKDITAAVSQMTRAEQGLVAIDTGAALPPARAAVESLQRAFGRSRYLLRALAGGSRIDPSRRLTGDIDDARDWRRAPAEPGVREGRQVRELLNGLMDASVLSTSPPDPQRLRRLAESALAIDPSSALWQEIARALLDANDAQALQQVIGRVSAEALRGTITRTPLSREISPVERAFGTEHRQ